MNNPLQFGWPHISFFIRCLLLPRQWFGSIFLNSRHQFFEWKLVSNYYWTEFFRTVGLLQKLLAGATGRFNYPSRERIGNINDSLMSSIISMMHQFYIENRKHWWIFDVTSMFHLCFQCFSAVEPTMFHLLNINESSMKHECFRDKLIKIINDH